MPDVVVTVPMTFRHPAAPNEKGLLAWIAEGDAAGTEWTGTEWEFTTAGPPPNIKPGERVYVVCEDRLRGYAPLIRLEGWDKRSPRYGAFIRGGGAVAVTISERIRGFRGWRYRWWRYSQEVAFPSWQTHDLRPRRRRKRKPPAHAAQTLLWEDAGDE